MKILLICNFGLLLAITALSAINGTFFIEKPKLLILNNGKNVICAEQRITNCGMILFNCQNGERYFCQQNVMEPHE